MEELTFHLDNFDGPLELLLLLIQKNRMDLHDIPILELITQYTAIVEQARIQDPAVASSFIEMAARLVEMKSYLLLPHSDEGERMKRELTGQLIEYEQCRRMAKKLSDRASQIFTAVREPMAAEWKLDYNLHYNAMILPDTWQNMAGRVNRIPQPIPEQFEPLVSAPFVSVTSRVMRVLRDLRAGQARWLGELFSVGETRSTTVATFLAVLELVRGGRMTISEKAELALQRGRKRGGKNKS